MILGPGTGLGVAALVEADGRFTPVSSEACHIDFGPISPEEYALWPHLERAHGRVTSESVISGAGLARVHRARMMAKGAPDPHVDPPAVTAAALADPNGEEAASLRLYWRIVARFAGDMAVTFVATGGVTLSGGVLPRVVDFLDEAAFRRGLRGQGAGRRARQAHPDPARHPRGRGAGRHGGDRRRPRTATRSTTSLAHGSSQ